MQLMRLQRSQLTHRSFLLKISESHLRLCAWIYTVLCLSLHVGVTQAIKVTLCCCCFSESFLCFGVSDQQEHPGQAVSCQTPRPRYCSCFLQLQNQLPQAATEPRAGVGLQSAGFHGEYKIFFSQLLEQNLAQDLSQQLHPASAFWANTWGFFSVDYNIPFSAL